MPHQPYSVEQVANLLGLHVKTVRGYVRDGRLKAVRIGKQYRIAREDLEAFTGHPVAPPPAETARRTRHAEVSSVVQVDAISRAEVSRLTNTLMAVVAAPRDGDERLRVESIYDEERAVLKIIVIGGLTVSADLFRIVTTLLEDR
ncbi:helix-turn-helix domain-containing protein [Microbispora sp. ATCC PTA-5024]|uniref:helix-turn-helix domain-containing protein n=1 Tax=Microbispora sp. ATCC PTA-5024 TaxID=316330 RepID=UPI0003DCC61A|nr:helix-turn-helix domain-containing protein [Microbispora sp. ATCC PTA-5024]ETK37864.1 MerR family transcriptional regulator [Microbispora sp. ATCC PTA-5024]